MSQTYEVDHVPGGVPIKRWTRGVPVEPEARAQLANIARLPFIHKWVAAMPDVHLGKGATVGSVIPTVGAIVPAAVGVDIGCGMMAVETTLTADQLPDNLAGLRSAIEAAVPHGRGKWPGLPHRLEPAWAQLTAGWAEVCEKYPKLASGNTENQLGTLGGGNHFVEVCVDTDQRVWFMLHSGSRGVGNRIGQFFIAKAKQELERWHVRLPDTNLAYLPEGSRYFDDYVHAVAWAQDFARLNREAMIAATLAAARKTRGIRAFGVTETAVNCHHNYVAREHHYGKDVWITRKGAVSAREGELGIIPGSMGAKSFIVRGKGHKESFCSCSHGAGRAMSRTAAKKRFTVADHAAATAGVECRKDAGVIDETPMAYKDIDAVMAAQADLVDVVATLKQVVCVKG